MMTLDELAPGFRAAVRRWPTARNLQEHYRDLSATFGANGCSTIELCKSFIETVCITILNELGKPVPAGDPTTTQLVGSALSELGLKNTRGASAFDKVLSAYNKLTDALNEMRNHEGTVAHGKDGFLDALTEHHARAYALSADTVVMVLLAAFDGVEPSLLHTREPFGRFTHLDRRIDGGAGLAASIDDDGILVVRLRTGRREDEGFDLRIRASELLYALDRQAYLNVLDALRGAALPAEVPEESPPPSAEEGVGIGLHPTTSEPAQVVESYTGRFAGQVHLLYEHLFHAILAGRNPKADVVQQWANSLLAGMDSLAVTDWSTRDATVAAVRLLVKRTSRLLSLGIDRDEAQVQRVVDWLAENIRPD